MDEEELKNPSVKKLCVELVPIFNHLTYSEQLEIARISQSIKVESKEVIFRAGDSSDHLYIIHKGRVKLYTLSESGNEQLIRVLEPGDFMGEFAIFTDEWLTSFAEALEPVELCAIQKVDLQVKLEQKPGIAMKLLAESSRRLQKAEKAIEMLHFETIETRLAAYLLEQSKTNNSSTFTLPITKKDLASYLGSSRETLSRRINQFEANGWITQQIEQRKIKIIDYDALRILFEI